MLFNIKTVCKCSRTIEVKLTIDDKVPNDFLAYHKMLSDNNEYLVSAIDKKPWSARDGRAYITYYFEVSQYGDK